MAETGKFCKGQSWHGRAGLLPCGKDAVRDGFCGVHHPDAEAKRKAKSEALSQARMAKWDKAYKCRDRRRELTQRMQGLTAALAACTLDCDEGWGEFNALRLEAQSIMRALGELEDGNG